MEEILAVENSASVADVSTSSDAIEGVIEVEAFIEAEREGAAVDWLVSAFAVAADAIERRRPGGRPSIKYRKKLLYIEYSNDDLSRGDDGDPELPRGAHGKPDPSRRNVSGGQGGDLIIGWPDADDAARVRPSQDGKGSFGETGDRVVAVQYLLIPKVGWHPSPVRPPGV
ncbi:hypothetical protein [Solwaraspora sp. WMMD792]|uniref:hypothetical protein n=1 Tax=Solwaraspora sp. WMMD792 TaxID=3016099 RepID=UPI0024171475|nr:hypothetical protein [Solwaraspora sp. WMMD792]MDG4771612.1 hypothetical protein [Solwaraspora sp. WMMD792]